MNQPQYTEAQVNEIIATQKLNTNLISDGYHTFGELYDHRITLFIALCRCHDVCWRSRAHSDGSIWEGWFVLGLFKTGGIQITYHLPESRWDECGFAETLERAHEWDGHTSADVLERIKRLVA